MGDAVSQMLPVNGINLHAVRRGEGTTPVLFVHGNLASVDWLDLVYPYLPPDLRIDAVDWRGCGRSDKPEPTADFQNYAMAQHADDMLAAMDALGLERCHLITHSTGGIISSYMLFKAPERFARVLALDPVSPKGLKFDEQGKGLFAAMKASPEFGRFGLGVAMATLFKPETLIPGTELEFRQTTSQAQKDLFEQIVAQSRTVSDGIWLGTPHNLNLEFESGALAAHMGGIAQPHLVVWGMMDAVIPQADMDAMAKGMPDCRVVKVPGVGHSMNIEHPALFAGYIGGFLSGVPA